jgi:hypothetical protein
MTFVLKLISSLIFICAVAQTQQITVNNIRPSSKQGNGSKIQTAGTNSGVPGATLCNNASGATTTVGCTSAGGTVTNTPGNLAPSAIMTGNGGVDSKTPSTAATVNGLGDASFNSVSTTGSGPSCIDFTGATSGTAKLCVADIAGTPTQLNLPITSGTAGKFLSTDGGNPQQLSWATVIGGSVCEISQFNPTADGTTDDSAVFTTAQSTCSNIILTDNKQYAIGTNLTLTSGIMSVAPSVAGALVIKTAVTLTLNGTVRAPLSQLFVLQGTGAVAIGRNTPFVPVEWFGAKGDWNGSTGTDDTTAIQNAINAVNVGTVTMQAKAYKHSGLVITHSYENLVGQGMNTTVLINSATTGDSIKLNGGGTLGNCASDGIWGNTLQGFWLKRVTPGTAGTGLNISKGCLIQVRDVQSDDSVSNFFISLTASSTLDNTWAIFNSTSSSIAGYGYYLDGSSGTNNNSIRIKHAVVVGRGITGITGLAYSGCIGDLFLDDFEVAVIDYGINLTAGTSGAVCNEDVHLNHLVLDGVRTVGVLVSNYGAANAGGRPSALINDMYFATGTNSAIGVDIENSWGVSIDHGVIQSEGAGGIGVKINSASQFNAVTNVKFDETPIGVSILSSGQNKINNNSFVATVGLPATTHINVGAGSNLNLITNNQLGGYATTGILLNATALGNIAWPNIIDQTSIPNAITSNGGKGNVVNGVGYSSPTVGTCGTIGTNSVNAAGFITSNVTGACVSVLTFDVTRMGAAGIGWSCSIYNSTTANLIRQTGSSTTTATFSGTTVTGDILPYSCVAY